MLFTLDANGTLQTATTFDYETNASIYSIRVQAKDEYNATVEANFTITLTDVYEDTDGDGFQDSLEASTGSDLNDPNTTPNKGWSPGTRLMATSSICPAMETMAPSMGQPWEPTGTAKLIWLTV